MARPAFGERFEAKPRDPELEAVRAFNDHLGAHPALHSINVPIGDGLWVCVKR